MHVLKRVRQVIGAVFGIAVRHRKLSVAIVVVLLLVVPLALTRDGEIFVLNAVGLGIAGVIVRRLARFGRRRRNGDR